MESMKLPAGYLLPDGKTMADIRQIDLELLATEGIKAESVQSAKSSEERREDEK